MKPKNKTLREAVGRMLRKRMVSSYWIKPSADAHDPSFGCCVKTTIHRETGFDPDSTVDEPKATHHLFVYGVEFGYRYLQVTKGDHKNSRTYRDLILRAMEEFKCGSSPEVVIIRKPEPSDSSADMATAYYLTEAQIDSINQSHLNMLIERAKS